MRSRTHVIVGRLAIPILLVGLAATPQGLANFLVDPSFEDPSLVVPLDDIVDPLKSGFWGVEKASSVTGPGQGDIWPHDGRRMLRMYDTGVPEETHAFQFVHFPSGAPSSLIASAYFNSASPNPARAFVSILGYKTANDWDNHIYSVSRYITLDTLPLTWQLTWLNADNIPSTVKWIGFRVGFVNKSLEPHHAGYVDETELVLPEPTSALLLVLGSAWLLAFRRR